MLWIRPDRAAALAIADGDEVEVNGGGRDTGCLPAKVTRWIHPNAVLMLHGYGATVPLATPRSAARVIGGPSKDLWSYLGLVRRHMVPARLCRAS